MVIYNDFERNLIVSIEDSVIRELKRLSIASFPNETGGFLAGRYISNNHATIEFLVPPKSVKCSPYSFERYTGGMEELWNCLYKQGLIYLGEWHSHPNGSCCFSHTDLEAMRSIASSKDIHISRPLLIIISLFENEVKDISLYHLDNNQLIIMSNNGTCRTKKTI